MEVRTRPHSSKCCSVTETRTSPKLAEPFLTIAICTLDRVQAPSLARRVASSAAAFPDVQITVHNNGPRSSIEEEVKSLAHVRFEYDAQPGLSRARNSALSKSRAQYVHFLDDDVSIDDGYVSRLRNALLIHSPDIIGAPINPKFDEQPQTSIPLEYVTRLKSSDSGWLWRGTVSGGNFGVRRALALSIGGFREDLGMMGDRLGFLEELEFVLRYRASSIRRGAGIYYAIDCSVLHDAPKNKTSLRYLATRAWSSHFQRGRLFASLASGKRRRAFKIAALAALMNIPRSAVRDMATKPLAARASKAMLSATGSAGLACGALTAPRRDSNASNFPQPDLIRRYSPNERENPLARLNDDEWRYSGIEVPGRPPLADLLRHALEAPRTRVIVLDPRALDFILSATGLIEYIKKTANGRIVSRPQSPPASGAS